MTARQTLVALSPHLDDVALSAAGTVSSWPGKRVLATVFSGDPPNPQTAQAAAFHAACGLGDDPMGQRRAEDRASCELLGCEPAHLGLREALYRVDAAGEPVVSSVEQLFDGDARKEPYVIEAVARSVQGLLETYPDAAVLAPAGRGRHRDHVILREAAERLGAPLLGYYEEQPYGWRGRAAGPPVPAACNRETCLLDGAAWDVKLRSLACHRSQVQLLWGAEWSERLAAEHARKDDTPVEVLWRAPG